VALLAEAYGKAGQPEEGLNVLDEALAIVHRTGERYSEAELYRLKGTLTLQKFQVSGSTFHVDNPLRPGPSSGHAIRNPQLDAEVCFLKAVEIARQQQTKSLELRAVLSLSRLWQQQGRKAEAREVLAEIYSWFTEGFATKDLQEAKALLAELA
jgi:predicted ATPase